MMIQMIPMMCHRGHRRHGHHGCGSYNCQELLYLAAGCSLAADVGCEIYGTCWPCRFVVVTRHVVASGAAVAAADGFGVVAVVMDAPVTPQEFDSLLNLNY